ncbi:relaxase/mobilization nuclease domain-containing protein [Polaribacter huanghezhanensis]|uniref:relaxase/mobilization nuclease domain-containing protein n=1 Tax=Polaribacter huanghezhanensis TaxID=1354726 RepID=UPI00264789B4|nr:hypothetical protein [Polaribacter huanghezhanensis]
MQDIEQKREQLVLKQFVQGYHSDKWVNAFKENDNNRTFRHAKRTVLRHEIISFSPKSNQYLTRDVLKTIAKYYLKHRSPKSLGICTVHYDKAPHIHFVISGVGIGGVSTRISREEFKAFKIKLQEFQQQLFPELSHSIVNHSKKKALS